MRTGGWFGFEKIEWFNGGLFDNAPALPLKYGNLLILRELAGDAQNWAASSRAISEHAFRAILDRWDRQRRVLQ